MLLMRSSTGVVKFHRAVKGARPFPLPPPGHPCGPPGRKSSDNSDGLADRDHRPYHESLMEHSIGSGSMVGRLTLAVFVFVATTLAANRALAGPATPAANLAVASNPARDAALKEY